MNRKACLLCMKNVISKTDSQWKNKLYSKVCRVTNTEVRKKRNALFEEELQRQQSFVKRIEKILVHYNGPPESCELLMNKHISTPYNCAMHIQEFLTKRSIVALVNGTPWDMHRPLTEDCTIEFKHMRDEDPTLPNKVFWRTGSFILGYVLETAFKDDYYVQLCSFPKPIVERGCFMYDADLQLPDWKPTQMELVSLSLTAQKLAFKDLEFQQLQVDAGLAQKMFEDNKFKSQQIPQIAEKSPQNRITLYRFGDHVDISIGPLISKTSQIFRFAVTCVHNINSTRYGTLQRVQALALPADLKMHWWNWDLLCRRAAVPIIIDVPGESTHKSVASGEEELIEASASATSN